MNQLFTRACTNQTTSWLMRSCNTLSAHMSHGDTQTHKTHHNPNLGEATTLPLIVFSVHGHGPYTQMSFCLGSSKILEIGTLMTLEAHNFLCRPPIGVRSKEKLFPCWELFKGMWHTTWKKVNQGDSWLLVVRNQIDILILGPLLAITCVLSTQMGHAIPF